MPRFSTWRDRVAAARVLVVGDVMLDRYWFGDVERISPEAPVPVVQDRAHARSVPAARRTSRATSRRSARTRRCCRSTGDDEPADALQRCSTRTRRDVVPARRGAADDRQAARDRPPAAAAAHRFRDGAAARGARAQARRVRRLLARADALVLSDYGKGGLAHIATMIERARAAGKPVLVDPKGDDWERYRGATLLTPNRSEFRAGRRALARRGRSGAPRAGAARDLDIDALLVTRSEEGMTLFSDAGALTIPAQAREVFDVSGAGDTVIATLGALLAAGAPLPDAMRIANEAAGVVVGKLGTAVAEPGRVELTRGEAQDRSTPAPSAAARRRSGRDSARTAAPGTRSSKRWRRRPRRASRASPARARR